jgi:thiol-disulfide isomerase/thioredoxin
MSTTSLGTAALTATLALALAGGAGAQPSDALFRGFEPTGEWALVVQGKEAAKAKIYDSTRAQALLIVSSEFASPVLIDRAGRTVSTLDLMKVAERADGTVDLLADALLQPAGTLQVAQTEGRFQIDGKSAAVRPQPWKLGPLSGAELLGSNSGYQWRAKRFTPDVEALAALRAEGREVRVLTFFGTWCPHCREHLPYLLRSEQELAGARIRFEYHGLPSPFTGEPEAAKWGVSGVPTTIVLVGGKEVGRIPNSGWTHPEVAVREILRGR